MRIGCCGSRQASEPALHATPFFKRNTDWTTTSHEIWRLSYARKPRAVQPRACNFCKAASALEKSAQPNKPGTIRPCRRARNRPRNFCRRRWLGRGTSFGPTSRCWITPRTNRPSFKKLLQQPSCRSNLRALQHFHAQLLAAKHLPRDSQESKSTPLLSGTALALSLINDAAADDRSPDGTDTSASKQGG